MSWGNLDCEKLLAPKNDMGGCAHATMKTCHQGCTYYQQELKLTKTQKRLLKQGKDN